MDSQLLSVPPKTELKSKRSVSKACISPKDHTRPLQLTVEQSAKISRLLQQLFQSISVLANISDLALAGATDAPHDQVILSELQDSARQAEETMHTLRDLRFTSSPVITELSQSLTVLVLAADMIIHGQLAGAEALSFYDLLRRNADTTMRCLNQLYLVFGL